MSQKTFTGVVLDAIPPKNDRTIWIDPNTNKIHRRVGNDWVQIGSDETLISLSYSELKELKDNSQLVHGTWYRITDYVTMTNQPNTISAGHQFDIAIMAITPNTFSEDIKAMHHEGDTYFINSNLNAWVIKYSFDRNPIKYVWNR